MNRILLNQFTIDERNVILDIFLSQFRIVLDFDLKYADAKH